MAAANNSKIYQFKLVLLGESAVGKSSLVLRFVRGQFFDYQESTIGGMYAWMCSLNMILKGEELQLKYLTFVINDAPFLRLV